MKHLFSKKMGEEHNFWMSYTDLMSSFLIVFILISIIMFQYYNDVKRRNEDYQAKLADITHTVDSLKGANLKNLIYEYRAVFKSNQYINIEFDSSRGSIVLTHQNSSSDLFPKGKADFQPELRGYLDAIRIPLVEKTMDLWRKRNYTNVELRIEGHTDPDGKGSVRGSDDSFLYNLDLSSQRANRVYRYILDRELNNAQREFVKKNMISVGYSFSRRVVSMDIEKKEKDASSRRIEFRIISK